MKISGSTPLYALLGSPVSHSLSPLLQNGWINEHGFDAVYVGLAIASDYFESALEGLFHAGLQGANVTTPFKERAKAACMTCSPDALKAGSVNCLFRALGENATGFSGTSTDGAGFLADLDARANGWRERSGHVVILGAGGAARSMLYAMSSAGIDGIHLVNRNLSRARDTAATIEGAKVHIHSWADIEASLRGASLVINATSAGFGGLDPLQPDFSVTTADCLVYDSVYAPRETAFLRAAKQHKRQALDGLGMLVGQGALAFETWFGVRPDIKAGLLRLEASLGS